MASTVAIIDDSRVSRMMVASIVKRVLPDCTIHEAANSEEAIELYGRESIDKGIFDLNMPGRDGLELAEVLAGTGIDRSSMAILTVNVQGTVQGRIEAAEVTFVPKPPSEDKLRAFLTA